MYNQEVSDVEQNEYNHFGPWIIEISAEDPYPQLFKPYIKDAQTPLYSIKIPREIERRTARPGMLLYNYVVCLYEEHIVILERNESKVITYKFLYKEILAIRHRRDLLSGHLHLIMEQKTFDLPFNIVSDEMIARVISIIRERYITPGTMNQTIIQNNKIAIKNLHEVDTRNLSFFFTGLLRRENLEHPEFRLMAAQTETRISTLQENSFKRIFFGAIQKTLLESIHLTNEHELKIISRGSTYKFRWQAVYGKETLFLPIGNLLEDIWGNELHNKELVQLKLITGNDSFNYVFTSNNLSTNQYKTALMAFKSTRQNKTKS